jgi:hypothetical protein
VDRSTCRSLLALVVAGVACAACAKEPAPLPGASGEPGAAHVAEAPAREGAPPAGALPEGHPPVSTPPADAPSAGTLPEGHPPVSAAPAGALPLKPEGIGSQVELDHCLTKIADAALRARFEAGFRACFTTMQASRDYILAAAAADEVLARIPGFAPAYRVLAYARLNTGFDMQGATELYRKAVEADPSYGEAHYGLAFMLTQIDPVQGRVHFEKAMELGIPDERDLRTKFYPSGT